MGLLRLQRFEDGEEGLDMEDRDKGLGLEMGLKVEGEEGVAELGFD